MLSLELQARRQHTPGQRPQLLLACLVLFCFCAGIGLAAGPVIGLVAQVPPLPCAGQQYTRSYNSQELAPLTDITETGKQTNPRFPFRDSQTDDINIRTECHTVASATPVGRRVV